MRAVGYVRVSTALQQWSPEWQEGRIAAACGERGWELVRVESDRKSGGRASNRGGLQSALRSLASKEADVLVVARLDRLSRSPRDFYGLLDRARREGWAVLCLDPAVDMTTPEGEAMAGMAIVFARFERALISQRQRDSVAARKARGVYRTTAPEVSAGAEERIGHLVGEGFGARRIMRQLELEGFRPPRGRVWHMSTVQAAMRRAVRSSVGATDQAG